MKKAFTLLMFSRCKYLKFFWGFFYLYLSELCLNFGSILSCGLWWHTVAKNLALCRIFFSHPFKVLHFEGFVFYFCCANIFGKYIYIYISWWLVWISIQTKVKRIKDFYYNAQLNRKTAWKLFSPNISTFCILSSVWKHAGPFGKAAHDKECRHQSWHGTARQP